MNWFNPIRWTRIAVVAALCTACATQPVVDTNVKINFPSPEPITSVEQADLALAAVALSKAQIDWRYRQKEQICYSRFFMNDCLLEAKNERRSDLALVKKSEVEANYFKRKNNVEEMDRALTERNLANPLPDPTKKSEAGSEPGPDSEDDKSAGAEPTK